MGYTLVISLLPILPETCGCHALCEHGDEDGSALGSAARRGGRVTGHSNLSWQPGLPVL